jgi:hypothetical protein
LSGVVDSFHVRKHLVEAHTDVPSNIFTHNPSGSCLSNNSKHFRL